MKADDTQAKSRRRKPAREAGTGRFDAPDPLNDPETFDSMVRVVRAVRELEPVLAASVLMWKQLGEEESARMAGACGLYLAELKNTALKHLAADPESLKEAKKLRLEAKVLGNLPLAEVQRIQQLSSEWLLDGVTPARLVQARPDLLQMMMKTAVALPVGLVSEPGPVLGSGDSK